MTLKMMMAGAAMALGAFAAAGARASVTYTYTGNDFTIIQAPYTTSDHVTIKFTQSSALGPNFGGSFDPSATYSASDGLQTITSGFLHDIVGTDSTGKINQWDIGAESGSNSIFTLGIHDVQDGGHIQLGANASSTGYNLGDPGTWTMTTSVPEPATWAMMLAGFGGLGVAMRSRRKPAALTA